jgi:ATP/maltotriose-dependent transcriptional regulator MalT/DNA-binding SARP family transcriptional activator
MGTRRRRSGLAKITPPSLLGIVGRPRLFRMLDRSRRGPLTWVTGPPGAGKTSLVADYLGRRRVRHLWYHVDPGDADVASFFYHVSLAATRTGPSSRRPLPLLRPENRPGLATFARGYFRELFGRLRPPFVLVLDNYHEVPAGAPLHQVLREGLGALPPRCGFIVISRGAPPPEVARWRSAGGVHTIGWDALRLTVPELDALVRHSHHRATPAELRRLHATTGGWAAGVALILERLRTHAGDAAPLRAAASDAVFDYFAGEVLSELDRPVREFLLTTSFLDHMTAATAAELTGSRDAERILAGLHGRSYFTEKRLAAEPVYAYHALFRDFLRARAQETWPAARVARIRRRAGQILARSAQPEEALARLTEAGDHEAVARLIVETAPSLLAQGRLATLEAALRTVPAEIAARRPWLDYWMGVCRLPFDTVESRVRFERAFERLEAARDATGTYLAWAGVADSIYLEWDDFKRLDPWIDRLSALRKVLPAWPAPEVEERVTISVFTSLMLRRPDHPEIGAWAERVLQLAQRSQDLVFRALARARMALYFLWLGDLGRAAFVLDALREAIKGGSAPPLVVLYARVAEAAYHWHVAEPDDAVRLSDDGLTMARTTGVHLVDYHLLAQSVYAALSTGDQAKARPYLRELVQVTREPRQLDIGHYHYLAGWDAMLSGDLPRCLTHLREALRSSMDTGSPFPEALNRLALAQALHQRGEPDVAREHLVRAQRIGAAMGSAMIGFIASLVEADFALARGETAAGLDALRRGLTIGRERGILNTPWWNPGLMARLCQRALEAGIEVEYAQRLVHLRRLAPAHPPIELESWPWALRIYTLGRFGVAADGGPVHFAGKVQQRPLALLKAIVALGGREIAEAQLAEALWPEADGDDAHQALAVTLHRLRRLLGREEAVVLRGGQVRLAPDLCWVDVWAFERLLGQADAARRGGRVDEARALDERALRLYRGGFLESDGQAAWAVSARERLRRVFLRRVAAVGHEWEAAGEWQRAAEWYERGLEVDDLAEELYQRLIAGYERLGRRADAVVTYERCRRRLRDVLGVAPSAETERLHRSARGSPAAARA